MVNCVQQNCFCKSTFFTLLAKIANRLKQKNSAHKKCPFSKHACVCRACQCISCQNRTQNPQKSRNFKKNQLFRNFFQKNRKFLVKIVRFVTYLLQELFEIYRKKSAKLKNGIVIKILQKCRQNFYLQIRVVNLKTEKK